MSTKPLTQNPVLQPADIGDAYQAVYDQLTEMYWQASTLDAKDQTFGAMQVISKIVTALDQEDLATNTAAFTALIPQMKAANTALADIQQHISDITRNINTASSVVAAIIKVLSLMPKF